VIWPFAIAAVVFWVVAFVGRRRGNLTTMRELIERHALICKRIAEARLRLSAVEGAEREAVANRLDVLERARVKAEQRAVRLRESLLKDGFALDGAQLTTVEEAETELRAELARRAATVSTPGS
jgi:hypothetical protein